MGNVTVLMPVYNAERYLRQAIESILSQTFHDFEFMIINDGSTDSSRDIVLSYHDSRIRLIDNETNIGLPRTLNRGLSLAKGEFIARQDADDESNPDRLAHQVAYLSSHPHVALLGSQCTVIDQHGNLDWRTQERSCTQKSILWELFFDNSFYA